MNAIQRKALADSIGVGTDQLAKFVRNEEKAKTLGDAIAEQDGLEKMVGQESLDAIAQIIADFQVMGAQLMEQIGPTVLQMAKGIGAVVGALAESKLLLPILIGYFATMKALSITAAIASIWKGAAESTSKIPFVGIFIGIAAAIGAVAMMMSALGSAGDMMSPAKGQSMISTKEGGLWKMSPNDDILAGPGLANGLGKMSENNAALESAAATNNQPVVQPAPNVNVDMSTVEQGTQQTADAVNSLVTKFESAFGFGGTVPGAIGSKVGDSINNRV